jgi:hypothetical protein
MDLRECEDLDWFHLAQERVEHDSKPSGSELGGEFLHQLRDYVLREIN